MRSLILIFIVLILFLGVMNCRKSYHIEEVARKKGIEEDDLYIISSSDRGFLSVERKDYERIHPGMNIYVSDVWWWFGRFEGIVGVDADPRPKESHIMEEKEEGSNDWGWKNIVWPVGLSLFCIIFTVISVLDEDGILIIGGCILTAILLFGLLMDIGVHWRISLLIYIIWIGGVIMAWLHIRRRSKKEMDTRIGRQEALQMTKSNDTAFFWFALFGIILAFNSILCSSLVLMKDDVMRTDIMVVIVLFCPAIPLLTIANILIWIKLKHIVDYTIRIYIWLSVLLSALMMAVILLGFIVVGIPWGAGLITEAIWLGIVLVVSHSINSSKERKKQMANAMKVHDAIWKEDTSAGEESPSTELAIPSGLESMQDHIDVIRERKEITEEQMVGLAKELYTIALYLPNQITWIENCSMSVKLEIKQKDEIKEIREGLEVSFWLREPIDSSKVYWQTFMNRMNDKVRRHRKRMILCLFEKKQPQKSGAYFVTKNWTLEGSTMSSAMAGLLVPARILAKDRLLELHTETVADIEFLRSQGEEG